MDVVAQNQVLLKGKLSQVLQAMEKHIPCHPKKCLCLLGASENTYWEELFLCQTSDVSSFSSVSGSIMLSPQKFSYPLLFSLRNPEKILLKYAQISLISV